MSEPLQQPATGPRFAAPAIEDVYQAALARCRAGDDPRRDPSTAEVRFARICDDSGSDTGNSASA